jgi:dihydropteroate synthase
LGCETTQPSVLAYAKANAYDPEVTVRIMGVVNVTPDSFSGDGELDPEDAIAHGRALAAAGADILDIGGEATNPKAKPVSEDEELRRVLPVIRGLAGVAKLSIDTTKARVAREAVEAGCTIVNDVSGGLWDPDMPSAITELDGITYIAGHLRGASLTEVFAAEAAPSWREIAAELSDRLSAFPAPVRARAWIDPGLGFGKGADPEGNLALIRHAGDLARAVGRPVVVGPSRKRFLRRLTGSDDQATLDVASVAACLGAVRAGAQVLRVHNVALLRAGLAVYTKL